MQTLQVRFNTLRWDPNLDQLTVLSTRPKAPSDFLCHLVVLDICPSVRKTLRIPVRKSVFGHKTTNVGLFDGILQVTDRDEVVKLYDFNLVCQMNKIITGVCDRILSITREFST